MEERFIDAVRGQEGITGALSSYTATSTSSVCLLISHLYDVLNRPEQKSICVRWEGREDHRLTLLISHTYSFFPSL